MKKENQKKYLLCDVDGVILDWMGGLLSFLESKGIQTTTKSPINWSLDGWIIGDHCTRSLIKEFNESDSFKKLRPIHGAVKHLRKLKKHGYCIILITSCGTGSIREARIENLENIFGDDFFEKIHCLRLGTTKQLLLEYYSSGVWIEDHFENALDGMDLHETFIFDQSYNLGKNHPRIRRVASWKEFFSALNDRS